jgi:hypothetical protein
VAYGKDIERVARAFIAQKLELDYIRHYLMETYQLDVKGVDQIFEKLGVKTAGPRRGPGGGPGKPGDQAGQVKKQSFY